MLFVWRCCTIKNSLVTLGVTCRILLCKQTVSVPISVNYCLKTRFKIKGKMKTSQHQFDLLVSFMEEHGDLTKPITNARGRIVTIQQWEELTSLLNSDGSGDTKTTEKWKKVWSDFKNNTKKKAARLHRAASGTGGGPAVYTKLTELEKRALNVIGIQAATGLVVAEAGLSQDIGSVPNVPEVSDEQCTQESHPIDECIELWNEPGPSSRVHVEPPLSQAHIESRPPSQAINEDIEIIENAEEVLPTLSPESHVAAPQVHPARNGQTTPRRSVRSSRIRLSPRRHGRLTQTEQAARQFVNSDFEWRTFRMQQHRDYMEMKREQNRIREMEVQNQREWQAIGLRTLDILDKLVNKFCKD